MDRALPERARTRGHTAALAAAGAMVRGPTPHAVLLSGPAGVGKTTLARDLAAGLLCTAPAPADRPCRACRGCRMVAHGGHPDLHLLGPEGPGAQIVIGGRDAKTRGVRDLTEALAMMPMEGGARVAIVSAAHRMNEDAQAALLKTLEEPPAGVTIILCADDEDRLLPTVLSRCARLRLGRVARRDVEAILLERGIDDVALAGRLARISGGRPGVALAYARSPDAVRARGELARGFLDWLRATPSARLAAVRAATPTAADLLDALETATAADDEAADPAALAEAIPGAASGRGRTRSAPRHGSSGSRAEAPGSSAETDPAPEVDRDADDDTPARAVPAARRRRAAETLLEVWMEVARDLALVAADGARSVRDPDLLEEFGTAAAGLGADEPAAFLRRLARGAELVAGNVAPELVLDALVLAWPRPRAA